MSATLLDLLRSLPETLPPAHLLSRIDDAIQEARWVRRMRQWTAAFAVGLVSLFGAILVYWHALFAEISDSSFLSYARTILSEQDVLFSYGKEMLMSLFESLPIINILVWSLLAFFVFGFVSFFVRLVSHPSVSHSPSLSS
jgi:hypothetical protein